MSYTCVSVDLQKICLHKNSFLRRYTKNFVVDYKRLNGFSEFTRIYFSSICYQLVFHDTVFLHGWYSHSRNEKGNLQITLEIRISWGELDFW